MITVIDAHRTDQEQHKMRSSKSNRIAGNGQLASSGCALSQRDQQLLADLEKKLQMVRDRTAGVAVGYSTGFLLSGPGGTSKSFSVMTELRRLKANYRVSNSRMTGRGLFDTLSMYPDAVHVLEDVEQMMHDKNAVGVLRSALWGQSQVKGERPERWVTWSAYKNRYEILFTGGIIVISNRTLVDMPELLALKTRVPCMHLQPTDNEIRVLMLHVASMGHEQEGRTMSPEECLEVCEYVQSESLALHRPLDMRLLINSFGDYLQWQEGDAGVHWRDMVAARIRERPTSFRHSVETGSRAERKRRELAIVKEIIEVTSNRDERLKMWQERTGKSEQSLYRRLADLDETEKLRN